MVSVGELDRGVAPASGLGLVQAHVHAHEVGRRLDAHVVRQGRRWRWASIDQRLARRRTCRARAARRRAAAGAAGARGSSSLSSAIGATKQVLAAACMSPRANERAAGRRQPARRVAADLVRLLVERPELGEVAVRLLEVIAEDLLELEGAAAFGVDLVGPAHELDVQVRARTLEQAVVDRVAHQVVVEAIDELGRRQSGPRATNCLRVRACELARRSRPARARASATRPPTPRTAGRSPTPARWHSARRGRAGRAAPRAAP